MDAHVYRPREIPGSILRQLYGLNLGTFVGSMHKDLTYALQSRGNEKCIAVVMDGTRVVSWALLGEIWFSKYDWISVYTRRCERGQGYAKAAVMPLARIEPRARHVYSRRVAFKNLSTTR